MSAEAYTRVMDLFTGILLGYTLGYSLWLFMDWYVGKGNDWVKIRTIKIPPLDYPEVPFEKPNCGNCLCEANGFCFCDKSGGPKLLGPKMKPYRPTDWPEVTPKS